MEYTKSDIYEEFHDELEMLEEDYKDGLIDYEEYMFQKNNLHLWLRDELEEWGYSE